MWYILWYSVCGPCGLLCDILCVGHVVYSVIFCVWAMWFVMWYSVCGLCGLLCDILCVSHVVCYVIFFVCGYVVYSVIFCVWAMWYVRNWSMIDRRVWIEAVFTQAHPSSDSVTKRDKYASGKKGQMHPEKGTYMHPDFRIYLWGEASARNSWMKGCQPVIDGRWSSIHSFLDGWRERC